MLSDVFCQKVSFSAKTAVGPGGPNLVPRPQTPKSRIFVDIS